MERLEEITVRLLAMSRALSRVYRADCTKGVASSLPKSSRISRSQPRYRRVSSRAPSASRRSLENFCSSNWAKMFTAVSYTTDTPCSDTVRAMQAERKVLPSPGAPVRNRFLKGNFPNLRA